MDAPTVARDVYDIARAAVADHTRRVLVDCPSFAREAAYAYALAWIEPGTGPTDGEHFARIRGVFAGLRDAGLMGGID